MITVVGSANMDLIASVASLPLPGETVLASHFQALPGGKGANQAVAAGRAGTQTSFVGCVGNDGHGEQLLASLRSAGVDVTLVRRDGQHPTGLAMIAVDRQAENSIIVVSGANAMLRPADVDNARELISRSSVVLLQLESPLETVEHAARLAGEAGATVILNPAPARVLEPELLALVDIVVPNEEEIARLSGLGAPVDPAAAAHYLLERQVGAVVVTLGARGTTIVTPDSETNVPAFQVPAVDTTGAGDAFVGNLASAIDRGEPLEAGVRFATAAAAWSVQHPGAQPSMPTRAQTESILKGEA